MTIMTRRLTPWIDIETTGFSPERDSILQIALIVTDGNLKEIARHDWIIKHEDLDELKANCDDFVHEMHEKTQLWDRMASDEAKPLDQVDQELSAILEDIRDGDRWGVKIGGNSVHFDTSFLKAQMPLVKEQLSHQHIDMSSILGFMRLIDEKVELPKHSNNHDAMADISWCLTQARTAREKIKSLS